MVELPIIVQGIDREDVLKVYMYLAEADVPILYGKRTIKGWNSTLDTKNKILKTVIDRVRKDFRMIDKGSNYFGIAIK